MMMVLGYTVYSINFSSVCSIVMSLNEKIVCPMYRYSMSLNNTTSS